MLDSFLPLLGRSNRQSTPAFAALALVFPPYNPSLAHPFSRADAASFPSLLRNLQIQSCSPILTTPRCVATQTFRSCQLRTTRKAARRPVRRSIATRVWDTQEVCFRLSNLLSATDIATISHPTWSIDTRIPATHINPPPPVFHLFFGLYSTNLPAAKACGCSQTRHANPILCPLRIGDPRFSRNSWSASCSLGSSFDAGSGFTLPPQLLPFSRLRPIEGFVCRTLCRHASFLSSNLD